MRMFECEAERPTLRTIYIYTHIRNINNLTSLLGLTESQNRKLKFTYGFVSLLFRLSYVIVKRLLRYGEPMGCHAFTTLKTGPKNRR